MQARDIFSYSEADRERLVEEPPKGSQLPGAVGELRDEFDRDRARVLHSAALRRLADKTQVVSPKTGDTPRTRLTHSLEVAQISRGIGAGLGVDTDLAELAGLCHDIGHPPYGHNGETALDQIAEACGGFEGNAQTLRILTRLEPKVVVPDGTDLTSFGLNLTRASLDAACKYPWTASSEQGRSRHKYSAYDEDAEILAWVRKGAPEGRKCLEAQIMDTSDDIAYSVHDVEDAILSGRVSLTVLWDLVELAALAEKGARAFGGEPDALLDAADRLRQLPVVSAVAEYDGSLRSTVALKAMTSQLVGRYVSATVAATRSSLVPDAAPLGTLPYSGSAEDGGSAYFAGAHSVSEVPIPLGRYSADLVIPEEVLAEVTLLKSAAVLYVMDEKLHQDLQERQRDRLFRVADYLIAGAPGSLDPLFRCWWLAAESEKEQHRVIVDQLASMTESRLERLDRAAARLSSTWS